MLEVKTQTGPEIPVLKESDNWIVVAKPPCVLVHSHPRFPNERTVVERLEAQLGASVWTVHRLDRPASGCLIYAKKQEAVAPLAQALSAGKKTYVCLVRGHFESEGRLNVDKPMKVKGKLRQASSDVWCLGRSREPRCSLLAVSPHTGRYHQVRRHVRDLTHPVLGDSEHGDSHENRFWRQNMGLKRLALHAISIDLILSDGQELQVTSPLFSDQFELYQRMPWWKDALRKEPKLGNKPLPAEPWLV